MSYIHNQMSVMLVRATNATAMITNTPEQFSASTTGKKAVYGNGYMPFIVRAVALQKIGTQASTAAIVGSFRKGTAGSTVATAGHITSVTIATSAVRGKVYYKDGIRSEVSVGDELQLNITTVSAAAHPKIRAYAFIEPRWETNIAGNSNMVASA